MTSSRRRFSFVVFIFTLVAVPLLRAEDGYRLWLRYNRVTDVAQREGYSSVLKTVVAPGDSATIAVARSELLRGLQGMLGESVLATKANVSEGAVLLGTPSEIPALKNSGLADDLKKAGEEGYVLRRMRVEGHDCIVVTANHDIGVLYGTFALLRELEMRRPLDSLSVVSAPLIKRRILDHWDNLNGSIERGYAGFSLWKWFYLPGYVDPRLTDYARADASIGVNGVALNNVNADPLILTHRWLKKVAAIANTFRPYGIHVYLSVRFSAPIEVGGLKTADPRSADVKAWWAKKADEIYQLIPDFGGFLVKANSEGQPGPQDYGCTHAQGANLLARALAPHGGIVMWRAFVYNQHNHEDRIKQAYDEFKPLDGKFDSNVVIQIKNGPLDFQPREPFHPLFGAMPHTNLALEVQIAQEYLGESVHLCYLAPLYKECLDSDTYQEGPGSTVAKVIDGSLYHHSLSVMAGVANTGDDRNWCGHPIAAANWYAFGRLAWNHNLSSRQIADEWVRMTFSNNPKVVNTVTSIMMESREAGVNYREPLGLAHQMAWDHHYGPQPWFHTGRPDWTPVYYNRADTKGLGFDRTTTGSNAVSQYAPPVARRFNDLKTCPEKFLLWFHHVPWDYRVKSGQTMWDAFCLHYQKGVDTVAKWQTEWDTLKGLIDRQRFEHVKALLHRQEHDAKWWRDACLLYFQTFSRQPLPPGVGKPAHTLAYYKRIQLHYVPGTPGMK